MQELLEALVISSAKKILFVCVHNSGRSQMAEAFFNMYAGGKAEASSAGTQPAKAINPDVVTVMKEVGLDISSKKPKLLTMEMMECSEKAITMGCNVEDVCPATFTATEDWQLTDPEGKPLSEIRRIRDQIKLRVTDLINSL